MRLWMGLRQRSSFLQRSKQAVSQPSKVAQGGTYSVVQATKASIGQSLDLRRRRAGERAAQCESCSVPPRGKLHIKRGNPAGWALSSPTAVRWSQKLAKKDPEKTGWTSCKGQDIRRTIISIQSRFSNLYLMPCTIAHRYKQPDYIKV